MIKSDLPPLPVMTFLLTVGLKGSDGKRNAEDWFRIIYIKPIINVRNEYNSFMEIVFSYCGTSSLSNQLKTVNSLNSIKPGDIFVKGGFPGHAVTVMAVAKNNLEQRIFLLSQGYMPAQDVHILKNPGNPKLSPWYDISGIYPLYTPQWQFGKSSLKHW